MKKDWASLVLNRRSVIKRSAALAMSVPAVSALIAACGNEENSPDPTEGGSAAQLDESTSEPGETEEAEETEAPATSEPDDEDTEEPEPTNESGESSKGGRLRVALTGDPPNLDIIQSSDSIVVLVGGHIYETLFTWDAEYRPVPYLAESLEVSDDGLVNTITLRPDVPFHNGEILSAKDVIASVERWGAVSSLGRSLMKVLEEMVEVDPLTIEFHLSEPFGTLAMTFARQLQGCAIYPASVLANSTETDLAEFIGTGPYRFVEWNPDQHILLERFDDYAQPAGNPDGYAGAKAQHFDEIEFVPVPAEASRVAGLLAGDYHYVETLSPDHLPAMESADNITVETLPADAWINIVLNMRSPVFEDLRVRRAVQVCLDHQAIMQAAVGEGFYELTPELVPGAPVWYTEAGSEYFNVNDPEQARSLLEEAGYDGAPIRILVSQEIQQEYNATLTMAQQMEAAGFTIDLQVMDGASLSDLRNEEDTWEIYTAWASFRPDPSMRNLSCNATGWWCEEEKDQMLADMLTESDIEVRFELWEQVQQRFYEDVPRLKIGNTLRVNFHASALRDIGPTEMQPDFSNAWLEG